MNGFFITATNTDRGKTLITAALRLWLQGQGLICLAMKPVQTGMAGRRLGPDLYSIYAWDYPQQPSEEEVLGDLEPLLHLLQPYSYQRPCSPHLAAECDSLPAVDLQHVAYCAQELQGIGNFCDILLIEGAGGFFVPLDRNKRLTVADMAQELGLPVILVAQSGLGAINDTCLSLMAIKQWGLPIAGFLLNDSQAATPAGNNPDYIRQDNPTIITELSAVPYLGTLPYLAGIEKSQNAALLLQAFESLSGLDQLQKYLPEPQKLCPRA